MGFRRGGRGLVPLVSGLVFSLPNAGLLCAIIAIPVAVLTRMRGGVYDVSVTIAVPLGLGLGTHDWRSLAPAAVIVVALVTRSRLRRVTGTGRTDGASRCDHRRSALTPHRSPNARPRQPQQPPPALGGDGGIAIFLLMTVQCVGVPFPSEVIMPVAGYFASTGPLNLVAVIAVGIVGNLIGS